MRVIDILALLGSISSAHKLSSEWIRGADDMLEEAGAVNDLAAIAIKEKRP